MSVPTFSVVIPAYNASKFIKNALDSVRTQTFSDYEIIVVNDGSIDDTLKVIKDYFSKFPILKHKIINQQNKGIGAARNAGIKVAEGEYIAFLDADDRWFREKLATVKKFFDENSDLDLVCHDEFLVKNGKVIKTLRYGPYNTYRDLLFRGNCISTSATVVKRQKILKAGLFSENLDFNGVEDYELWLRLSKLCKMAYLHKVLGEYNVHAAGITSNIKRHKQNVLNVIEHHFEQWPHKTIYYKYLMRRRKAETLRNGARAFLRMENFSSAQLYFLRSLFLHPFSIKTWVLLAACILRVTLK